MLIWSRLINNNVGIRWCQYLKKAWWILRFKCTPVPKKSKRTIASTCSYALVSAIISHTIQSQKVNGTTHVLAQNKLPDLISGNLVYCFRIPAGNSSDHGSSFSKWSLNLSIVSSIWTGISSRRYLKYSYGLRLLALAISASENRIALAFAPLTVSIRTKFFLDITKFRI